MILHALKGYYDRVAATDPASIPPPGFSMEQIAGCLVLARDGIPIELQDEREQVGRNLRSKIMCVPLTERTSGIKPKFLWDNTSYVFGVSDRSKRAEREHAAFVELHESLLSGETDEGLQAVLKFLQAWSPEHFANLPRSKELLDQTLVFRLEGEHGYIHERPATMRVWLNLAKRETRKSGQCLISGTEIALAELHPAISGVPGAQTSGAYLVSFNQTSFESFGKTQGLNSPVSEVAAFAYTTGLNDLLSRMAGRNEKGRPNYTNRLQMGDATTVFWAQAPDQEDIAAAEFAFAWLADPPSESPPTTDAAETSKVRDVIYHMAAGRPIAEAVAPIAPGTKFYVLGLSPNAARLSVRFYHQTTFGDLAARFEQHWRDLHIEPVPWQRPPAIWRLLLETAARQKSENISPNLAGEVMRAILNGTPYPRTLLAQVIVRLRADGDLNGHRAAIIKACLVRTLKEDVPVSLDKSNPNPGYRLGRLFAVLEGLQRAAIGKDINATMRDKFYGSASATPARVFPLLQRGAQEHLGKVRKTKPGLSVWFDREIAEIMGGLKAGDFPRTLRLEEQGQFAIGFYHERDILYRSKGDAPLPNADDATAVKDTNLIEE